MSEIFLGGCHLLDIFRLTAIKNNSNQPEIIKKKVLL